MKTLYHFQRLLAPFMTSSVRRVSEGKTATFETRPYKLHKLDEAPNATSSCTREEALLYYKQMQMIRRLESASGNLYKEKVYRKKFSLYLYLYWNVFVCICVCQSFKICCCYALVNFIFSIIFFAVKN